MCRRDTWHHKENNAFHPCGISQRELSGKTLYWRANKILISQQDMKHSAEITAHT